MGWGHKGSAQRDCRQTPKDPFCFHRYTPLGRFVATHRHTSNARATSIFQRLTGFASLPPVECVKFTDTRYDTSAKCTDVRYDPPTENRVDFRPFRRIRI